MNEYGGVFPSTFDELIRLKGVGRYTAAAVASISSGEPVAAVDGNVSRVVSRLFMIKQPVNGAEGAKFVAAAASELLDHHDPGTHNQAMMELGALICTPRNPDCPACPISDHCLAFTTGKPIDFPVKLNKTKVTSRYFTYFILRSGDQTYLVKRTADDIWNSLFEFPLVETSSEAGEEALAGLLENLTGTRQGDFRITRISPLIEHRLTHRRIHARFVHAEPTGKAFRIPKNWTALDVNDIEQFPVPRLIDRYLQQTEI
jgi:A/G-specific adenine glycosylase